MPYANAEARREYLRAWKKKNREKVAKYRFDERSKKTRTRRVGPDKERARKRRAEWRATNRHRDAAYRDRNRDRIKKSNALWRRANREQWNALTRANHAKRASAGKITAKEMRTLKKILGDTCAACGAAPISVDHVVAISVGGANRPSNIQFLCKPCNSRKGTKSTDYRSDAQRAAIARGIP